MIKLIQEVNIKEKIQYIKVNKKCSFFWNDGIIFLNYKNKIIKLNINSTKVWELCIIDKLLSIRIVEIFSCEKEKLTYNYKRESSDNVINNSNLNVKIIMKYLFEKFNYNNKNALKTIENLIKCKILIKEKK